MKYLTIYIIICLCLFHISCRQRKHIDRTPPLSDTVTSDTSSINAMNLFAYKLIKSNPDSALVYLNKSLMKASSINFNYGKGEALYFIGVAYFYKYHYDTALYLHKKAYEIFKEDNNRKGMAQTQYSMSYDYSLMQNMPKSLECMENAKYLLYEIQEYNKACASIDGLIFIHKQLHNNSVLDSLIKELVETAEKSGNKKIIAGSYITQGNHYADQAYMNLAIEAFYKALNIAEESGDSVEISNAMGSIAMANLYIREYQKSADYYLEQEAILKKLNDEYQLSIAYEGLGKTYNGLTDYKRGLEYHFKSLTLCKKINYQIAISNSLYNIGYTYSLIEDSTDLALSYINRALKIDSDFNNLNGLIKDYMLIGKIHSLRNNNNTAIKFLEKSLLMAKQFNNTDVLLEASGLLVRLYAKNKNFEKAYNNMLLNNELSDSLINGENLKRITQLEMQHAFDKKQNEIEIGHLQEKIVFETKLKRNKLAIIFSLLFGSFVIAFGTFMFYSYRKSRKADKEKEALLKEIHHRVKNNLMVISSLLNLQSGSITDDNTKSAVKESQSRVKSMALIHQLLYQSEMFSSIDFPKYLEQLMSSLHSTYSKPGKNIKYIIQADNIKLDIDTAIPLGLITNELATNAYKYAFSESTQGKIEIDFRRTNDHKYLLRISDDGKGLPKDFNLDNSNTLGLKLVKILTKQIKAKLSCELSEGTEFNIVFAANT